MKKEFLENALNEISNEHLAEALSFKKRSASFYFKLTLSGAACFLIVAIAAIASKSFSSNPVKATTENQTYPAVNAVTENFSVTQQTEIAIETSNDIGCPTAAAWENTSLFNRFSKAAYQGNEYIYCSRLMYSESEILKSLCACELEGKDISTGKIYKTKAELFKIISLNLSFAVAVKFEESHNYYIYSNPEYLPESIDSLLSDLSLKNNVSSSNGIVYHEKTDNVLATMTRLEKGEEAVSLLLSLLETNKDLKPQKKAFEPSEENISFNINILDIPANIKFSKSGLLAFDFSGNSFVFELTEEDFSFFLSSVKGEDSTEATTLYGAITLPESESIEAKAVTSPAYNPGLPTE